MLVPVDTALASELRTPFEHVDHSGRRGPEVVRTWRIEGEWLSLPRGGTQRVRDASHRLGVDVAWVDERAAGLPELAGLVPKHRYALRGYQREMVSAASRVQNCILRAGTGSGKTCAVFGLAAELNLPTLVIVWTGELFRQWVMRCGKELGLAPGDVGQVRGKAREVRSVTIAMQQTLHRDPAWVAEHARDFGLVVLDELQRAPARTVYSVADPWWARYRVGVSADESRRDKKEFLTYDLFGQVACEVPEDRLVAEGAVLPVEVRVVPTEFRADWYVARQRSGRLRTEDNHRLTDELCHDKDRNAEVVRLACDEVRQGESVLVWSARVEHCHRLDAELARHGVMSGLLLGGDEYAQRFAETRRGLEDGTLRAGVGTVEAVGTGIDIPMLSRGIMTRPMGNNRQLLGQAKGRLCRPESRDAAFYYLWDRHVFGRRALENLVRWHGKQVVVRSRGVWVDGRHYLRGAEGRTDAAEVAVADTLEGIFT